MLYNLDMNDQALSLYITSEHPCGYYSDRLSANLIPDPQVGLSHPLYSLLISKGFRRSGGFVYRPHCPNCSACQPCRINIEAFEPNRNQRRCLSKNYDLTTHLRTAEYSQEYYELYRRYINSRHNEGSMANPSEEDFRNFLLCDWSQTLFIESRKNGRLLAVAVADYMSNGLSAVYTFFDPDEHKRSLGTHAILQQIWLARLYNLPHLYLGYWIQKHPKMDYKGNFNALEILHKMRWCPVNGNLE